MWNKKRLKRLNLKTFSHVLRVSPYFTEKEWKEKAGFPSSTPPQQPNRLSPLAAAAGPSLTSTCKQQTAGPLSFPAWGSSNRARLGDGAETFQLKILSKIACSQTTALKPWTSESLVVEVQETPEGPNIQEPPSARGF